MNACLGFPLALEKLEGPATSLVFLGILIDTVDQELRLPLQAKMDSEFGADVVRKEKVYEARATVDSWPVAACGQWSG